MRFTNYLFLTLLSTGLLTTFCGKQAAQQMPPPEIQVMKVIQRDVPLQRDFVGQIYGLQDIPIRARVEGYLEGIHFNEGLPVRKGQHPSNFAGYSPALLSNLIS